MPLVGSFFARTAFWAQELSSSTLLSYNRLHVVSNLPVELSEKNESLKYLNLKYKFMSVNLRK